jgi:hypothetical protein
MPHGGPHGTEGMAGGGSNAKADVIIAAAEAKANAANAAKENPPFSESGIGKVETEGLTQPEGYADPSIPMDPEILAMIKQLGGWGEDFKGDYAARLKQQAGAQLMAGMQDPTGQTAQQMGSRGMGRVAQLAQQSEATYLHELVGAQYAAEEMATTAAREITTEISELLKLNLDQQGVKHEWSNDAKTHMANQYNEYMTAIENMLTLMRDSGAMDTEAEWEALGLRLKEANAAFAAATSDEERSNVKLYYWGEAAYIPASTDV